MSSQKSFKGLFNWSFLLIILVGIIAVNVISSYAYRRLDMTSDSRYSLAQGTIDFLDNPKNFESRMTIRIYLDGNMPAELKYYKNAIEDKLKEFKQFTGSSLEYKFIDPNDGSDEEQKELKDQIFNGGKGILPMNLIYQKDGSKSEVMLWPGAVINYKGTDVNVIQFLPGTLKGNPNQLEGILPAIEKAVNNLEYVLMSSIRRAVQTEKKKIGFLQGQGELHYKETQRARALLSPYFKVEDVVINGQLNALDGVDGLIIANPTKKFDVKDLFIIDQFLMRGGRLMCFMDALKFSEDTLNEKTVVNTVRNKTGLEDLLFDYGLKLNENYVLDINSTLKTTRFASNQILPWYFNVLATPTAHPISRNLAPVHLKYANEIQFVESSNTAMTPILTSSLNSTTTGLVPLISLGIPLNYGRNPQLAKNPGAEENKKCLAGLSEGMFSSYYKTRIVEEYVGNPDARFLSESQKEGKVILVGNGRFIANRYDSTVHEMTGETIYRPIEFNDLRMDQEMASLGYPMVFGNQEFLQNIVDYVMDDNSVLDIRSRQIDVKRIDSEKVQTKARVFKLINMIIPCLLVVVLALLFAFFRKRKYAIKF